MVVEQLLNEIIPNNNSALEPEQEHTREYHSQAQETPFLPDISSLQPHLTHPQQQQSSSNFSSVLSSFGSILNLGGGSNNNQAKEEFVAPPPAGLDNLIGQENAHPEPVPLFPTNAPVVSQQSIPPTTGPKNAFRRLGLKRPVYAPIPGLTSGLITTPPQQPPTNPHNVFSPAEPSTQTFPVASQSLSYPSSHSPANSVSSISTGKELSATNFCKPITPPTSNISIPASPLPELNSNPFLSQPPNNTVPPTQQASFASETSITQSQTSFIPPYTQTLSGPHTSSHFQHHHFFVPETSKHVSGLVMDAIPPSELLQAANMNDMDQYGTGVNGSLGNTATDNSNSNHQTYRPVYHHWFFQKESEGKKIWHCFSMVDSLALENSYTSNDLDPEKVIATDGGRYDVNILRRQRIPVYWKGNPNEVRRCSWFHKDSPNGRLVPYEENVATRLEEEYKQAFLSKSWHKRVELANGEVVVFHGPDVLVLFPRSSSPDAWGNTSSQTRPRIVKRGMDEFDIDEGESANADHILFMIHGIGAVCDLKFKSVEETVDEFRAIALQLVRSHYKSSCEKGVVHRVEVLPIGWHAKLHSEETGIDSQLKSITLESIPKLRDFTNDTLLDILFYTSPIYCQQIISSVATELNKIYDLYKQRNPDFKGGVSLGGHSLGSLILFDLLAHQHKKEEVEEELPEDDEFPTKVSKPPPPARRKMSRRISYMMGSTGTGQPQIFYPHLNFEPKMFFALGSPIGMFIIIRGLDTLGENFALPTCSHFFNIFHPYDPIAYRIESLIHSGLGKLKPVLIPHHKGRKRMHLELKETMARVGADLKQKVIDSLKSTWDTFSQYTMFHKPEQQPSLEDEVQKVIDQQMEVKGMEEKTQEQDEVPHGKLNSGRRIDYVLQEAPFEFINEYIFALTSHVCYWESEDTILMMLKEIYTMMSIQTDSQLPPQTMTIERPPPSPTSLRSTRLFQKMEEVIEQGMDPTEPLQVKDNLPPPPTSGFMKNT
ncbi:unnamed protein product [Acanthoscelides obtectus]|uniref:DDHD domain-containing protein n=1 Tax=Acanthoscelides obtectus TaxID=200917 RepID=A0A9P0JYE0_ACAOB|nr:unnamed protein product [Acanthoscelides obtectus]CAK1648693.1 Phospholipase DDHD2 [Acanthoscelides obtectus]